MSLACPCGSSRGLDACCGVFHDGHTPAPTAEALMRARYSAYALRRVDFLLASWHPDTRPQAADLHHSLDPQLRWLGLGACRT